VLRLVIDKTNTMIEGIKKNKTTRTAAGDINQKPMLALRSFLSIPSFGGATVAVLVVTAIPNLQDIQFGGSTKCFPQSWIA
jgi:hypothetical protein